MNTFQLDTQPRSGTGKKATKADRAQGLIPCVVYGRDGVEHFTTTHADVRKLVFSPAFQLVEFEGASGAKAILKDVQYHPTTEAIEHIDFLKLEDGYPVKVELPLRIKGVSPGVKGGGRLVQSVRKVKVKTLPEHLVDELFVSIDGLELGEAVRVRDIDLPDGVQLLVNTAVPVALVEVPRALRSAATAAAKEGAPAVEAEVE